MHKVRYHLLKQVVPYLLCKALLSELGVDRCWWNKCADAARKSKEVIIPTNCESSTTGMHPILWPRMISIASSEEVLEVTVTGFVSIISATVICFVSWCCAVKSLKSIL